MGQRARGGERSHNVTMFPGVALGAAISVAAAVVARRLKALTPSGAWAAAILGTVLFAGGGWRWLALVGAFFVPASALTRLTPGRRGTGGQSLDSEGRRWDQVVANGGIAALTAVIFGLVGWRGAFAAAAGATAAAAADTWGTEIGRWSAVPPRLITTGARVPEGTSGGVTFLGTIGEVAGAVSIAAVAALLDRDLAGHARFLAVGVAGVSGALLDSLLGATVENRVRGVDNSMTNLLATIWGAGIAILLYRWWR